MYSVRVTNLSITQKERTKIKNIVITPTVPPKIASNLDDDDGEGVGNIPLTEKNATITTFR